jgi:hypothetical protein
MAEEMRPASPRQAPDPAHSYERSDPDREAGMGDLDQERHTPTNRPDDSGDTVRNKSQPDRQLNAHETLDARATERADRGPDHSMMEEEPLDDAPTNIHDPRQKRQPRTGGKG